MLHGIPIVDLDFTIADALNPGIEQFSLNLRDPRLLNPCTQVIPYRFENLKLLTKRKTLDFCNTHTANLSSNQSRKQTQIF